MKSKSLHPATVKFQLFLEIHSVPAVRKHLVMIFFEYLRYCNKIGFPLDFDDMLAELEGLFEVLEEE